MSPAIITLIAWAPFLILALIFGIIFCLLGYKRGSARAGISVAATAIATVLSVLFAKLLSGNLADLVRPFVNDILNDVGEGALDAALIPELAMGLASSLCALILFIPMFILLASVLKPVTGVIVKRFIKSPKHIANKLGGLFISLVDALLVALLVLLPLYGTLSLAKKATPLFEEQKEVYVYVSAATDPFIVDVAGLPPFSTVYDSLLSFKVGDNNFNISSTAREALTLVSSLKTFSALENKFSDTKLLLSLIDSAEELLLSNDVAADFICQTISDKLPEVNMPGVGKISISDYYVSLGNSELLKNDLPALFDLGRTMIKGGMLSEIVSKDGYDIEKINAESTSKAFGKTFNHSNEIASFKSRLIKDLLSSITDSKARDVDVNEAVEALKNAIASIPETPYGKEDAKKEGEALYMIVNGLIITVKNKADTGLALGYILEGLARHPAIGAEVVMNASSALLGKSEQSSTSQLVDKIGEKLSEAVTKPVGQSKFPEFVDTAFDTVGALGDIQKGEESSESIKNLITADPEAIEAMKDVLSEDILKEVGMGDMSEKMGNVLNAVFDSIIESELVGEEADKEAEALYGMMSVLIDVAGNPSGAASSLNEKADDMIKFCAESKILENTLENLTESGESDPMGMFSGLDNAAKDAIESKIDGYIAENGASESLEALKQFIGLK